MTTNFRVIVVNQFAATFAGRKITRAATAGADRQQDSRYLGNVDAVCDRGNAPES